MLYYTKGSGSNGVDTVYFLDTTGTACPKGVGVPAPGATLPTTGLNYTLSTLQSGGLPSNMCILAGFPTAIAKNATDASDYPFGLWFANPTTLYVADEGAGDNTYDDHHRHLHRRRRVHHGRPAEVGPRLRDRAVEPRLHPAAAACNLGAPYTVRATRPATTRRPGCRGRRRPMACATSPARSTANGTVTIWAVTSTVSGGGDQGADPNELVSVTDNLNASTLPSNESFRTVVDPAYDQVVRGVSFTRHRHRCRLRPLVSNG